MQGLSALQESTLYCTQAFFFASVTMCELQPFPDLAHGLQHRGVHAWHAQFKACLGYYCAHPAPLVVKLKLLPPRTSNARVCAIPMMHRLLARLSLTVLHRMSFVYQ